MSQVEAAVIEMWDTYFFKKPLKNILSLKIKQEKNSKFR